MKDLIIDCFAGGGGASVGIEMALGRPVDIAINHDPEDKLNVIQNMLDAETHKKITKSDLLEILRWIVEEYL